jgi:hypothetical protein
VSTAATPATAPVAGQAATVVPVAMAAALEARRALTPTAATVELEALQAWVATVAQDPTETSAPR